MTALERSKETMNNLYPKCNIESLGYDLYNNVYLFVVDNSLRVELDPDTQLVIMETVMNES